MTDIQGTSSPGAPATAGVQRPRHWRVVVLVGASVSAVVLLVGCADGPVLLAALGMLVAVGHLLMARPWQRAQHHSDDERQS